MPKIYHYTKLSTAIEHILPKMQLRTNNLRRMNDPKENQPWSFAGRNIDYAGSYPETYSHDTHIDHQYKLGNEIKSSSQILCFVGDEPAKGYLNEIMWAHYAENHQGVCLEIDSDTFIAENEKMLSDFVFEEVTYDDHRRLFLGWEENLDKHGNIQRFVRSRYKDLFMRKSQYWERENERRLVLFEDSQKYLSIKTSLTGIYFGLQMPMSYRPAIDSYVNEDQTKLYNLYYEQNKICVMLTNRNDFRPLINRKYSGS